MKKRADAAELDAGRFRNRSRLVATGILVIALLLCARAVQLQVVDREFLAQEGGKRYLRDARVPAHRGAIIDRFERELPREAFQVVTGSELIADRFKEYQARLSQRLPTINEVNREQVDLLGRFRSARNEAEKEDTKVPLLISISCIAAGLGATG